MKQLLCLRVLAAQPYELQQQEEQGHYVQIEVESSEDIFLRRDFILPVFPTQDKLGVEHQILQGDRKRDDMLQPGRVKWLLISVMKEVAGNWLQESFVRLKNKIK